MLHTPRNVRKMSRRLTSEGIIEVPDDQLPTAKLWTSAALTPYGNECGGVTAVAETRDEAISKADTALSDPGGYVPRQRYAATLRENLHAMCEITDGVIVDWSAAKGGTR